MPNSVRASRTSERSAATWASGTFNPSSESHAIRRRTGTLSPGASSTVRKLRPARTGESTSVVNVHGWNLRAAPLPDSGSSAVANCQRSGSASDAWQRSASDFCPPG